MSTIDTTISILKASSKHTLSRCELLSLLAIIKAYAMLKRPVETQDVLEYCGMGDQAFRVFLKNIRAKGLVKTWRDEKQLGKPVQIVPLKTAFDLFEKP